MNKRRIKYIGYYSRPEIKPDRLIPLAGRNKMDYTTSVLERIFDDIEIISPAYIKRGERGCSSSVTKISEKTRFKLFSMFRNSNRFISRVNDALVRLKLFWYLLNNTEKDGYVLVYHSLAIINTILLAKKIRKFKLILELNEIYSDVSSSVAHKRESELKIINAADAFMFANDQLNTMFNLRNLPYVVEYGCYAPKKRIVDKFDDGKIHVVYAGTFDPMKGGAVAAVNMANYLDDNYHVHILGFGNKEQIEEIVRIITSVDKSGKCKITYDGQLDGEDFITFLQKCHIGLSTQNPKDAFNATSFPSKILTYLANGLQVVSIDIPAVSDSKISDIITFYKDQTPEAIAAAIKEIKVFESPEPLLIQLDKDLTSDMKSMFEAL